MAFNIDTNVSRRLFSLDHNVPLPPKSGRKKRAFAGSKYPFVDMKVGDSFFIPAKRTAVASYFPALKPLKFATRTVTEKGVTGTRIWRTK